MGTSLRGTHPPLLVVPLAGSVDPYLSLRERVEHVHAEDTNDDNRDSSDERDHDAVLHHRGALVVAEAGSQVPNVSNNWCKHLFAPFVLAEATGMGASHYPHIVLETPLGVLTNIVDIPK